MISKSFPWYTESNIHDWESDFFCCTCEMLRGETLAHTDSHDIWSARRMHLMCWIGAAVRIVGPSLTVHPGWPCSWIGRIPMESFKCILFKETSGLRGKQRPAGCIFWVPSSTSSRRQISLQIHRLIHCAGGIQITNSTEKCGTGFTFETVVQWVAVQTRLSTLDTS